MTSLIPFLHCQSAVGLVRMEDHSKQEPVHVTVQRATVGMTVEVSGLHFLLHGTLKFVPLQNSTRLLKEKLKFCVLVSCMYA